MKEHTRESPECGWSETSHLPVLSGSLQKPQWWWHVPCSNLFTKTKGIQWTDILNPIPALRWEYLPEFESEKRQAWEGSTFKKKSFY